MPCEEGKVKCICKMTGAMSPTRSIRFVDEHCRLKMGFSTFAKSADRFPRRFNSVDLLLLFNFLCVRVPFYLQTEYRSVSRQSTVLCPDRVSFCLQTEYRSVSRLGGLVDKMAFIDSQLCDDWHGIMRH